MHEFTAHLAAVLLHLGGFGLLLFGILDSSFLMMPLGNDLLVIALSANKHAAMPWYAAMATAGSVLGTLVIDWVARKGGEEGLARHVPANRLEYVKRKVRKSAGFALAVAALMPPPFPFTPFVAGAAALEYPRKKLLGVVAVARIIRFTVEGVVAIVVGRRILDLANQWWVAYAVIALIVIAVGGSAISIVRWVRRSKNAPGTRRKTARREAA